MIYGALGDIEEYRGMLKGLDVLIDWLEENDPAQLEVGSHPILGEKVFANVIIQLKSAWSAVAVMVKCVGSSASSSRPGTAQPTRTL